MDRWIRVAMRCLFGRSNRDGSGSRGVGGRGWKILLALPLLAGAASTPPLPPLPPSPVATFRHYLSMDAAARAKALADRPDLQREFLRARLAEYESMNPSEREHRLRATDLYWHFRQIVRRAPAERAALLAAAPEEWRAILEQRVAAWNRLSEADQVALAEDERALGYFSRLREIVPPPLPTVDGSAGSGMIAGPSVPLRAQAELARLEPVPPRVLPRVEEQWRGFIEGSSERGERALRRMTAGEREAMQQVLERFRRLAPEQRRTCVASFARLAAMPPAERLSFLASAERWEGLSAEERDAWRRMVNKLPLFPPLPVEYTPPPLPPLVPPKGTLTNSGRP